MLERARRRVRGLVRLLEKRKRAIVYTDFVDELGEIEEVALHRGDHAGDRLRALPREGARLPAERTKTTSRCRSCGATGQLTADRLESSSGCSSAAGIGEPADLGSARQRATASARSSARSSVSTATPRPTRCPASSNGRTLTADQHDFVALVVEHLTANGAMDVGRLYEPPFTTVAAGGPESLFPEADIDALIEAIRAVGANAEPRDAAA